MLGNALTSICVGVLFTIFFLFSPCLHAESVEMQLSRDKITFGETVTVSYYMSKAPVDSPDFSPLKKDFRVLSTNYSTTLTVVNGLTQTQTNWQVTLEPKASGKLIVPAIAFGDSHAASHELWVKQPSMDDHINQKNSSVFVKAQISTSSPYVQSQVVYTFKLFYRTEIENPRLELPPMKEVLIVQVGGEKSYQIKINGEHFYVLEKNFAFFPQQTGKLVIPPSHFQGSLPDEHTNNFEGLFPIKISKAFLLSTASFTIDVRPIPKEYEGTIWLPTRQLTIKEKWSADANHWQLGSPISRTIIVQAEGLRADQIPDLSIEKISDVSVYTERPKRNNVAQDNHLVGTWEQTITYIPNKVQQVALPSIKVNWWNTQTNNNATTWLKSPIIRIQGRWQTTDVQGKKIIPYLKESSRQLRPYPMESAQIKTKSIMFYLSIWLSMLLMLVLLLIIYWLIKQRKQSSNNTDLFYDKLDEKALIRGCLQGDAILVQRYLLSWAKNIWQHPPHNLKQLNERIDDKALKQALDDLEQKLYSDKKLAWHGRALLKAFQQTKRYIHRQTHREKHNMSKKTHTASLPPLHPAP